ncbi:LysR family transcriptional regulator [Pseudomonas syringae]|nr:LysR family transcriptional regulator [Pseudomonas syringae]MBD8577004.1 LysR family transcriptional regulator [Pseudomonas syringae]MBD8788297.1 LysR family transcriptional regulator [Pseudomonas syringae]MBD8799503.1 LysR family transcriptional regulator [Pseudomonas syringae]MBD8814769.1 LysR family transcriptional regulator [Pseudomonas syringae]
MAMIDDLSFFQQVATRGSLTEVARHLGLSLPAVSKRLSQLEARLGVQLLQRTTRRLSLTPEGTLYLEGGRPILRQLEELENALDSRQPTLQGLLRINGTLGFGRQHLAPIVSSFARLHPQLELSLELSSQPSSLLDDQFDLGVYMGEPPDSRLIAVRLLENPRILCAAPQYLEAMPELTTVADLAHHNCIVLRQFGSDYAIWRFSKDGRNHAHKVSGTLSSNDGEVALQLALDGHGVILRSRWNVQQYLESGHLRVLLADYQTPGADVFAVYQHRRHIPQRISVFTRFLAQELARRLPFAACRPVSDPPEHVPVTKG